MEACWKTILKSLFISWRFPQMHVLGLASCSAWHLIRKHPSFHFHTYLTACKPSQQSENQFWYYNGKKQRGLLTNFQCTRSKMCEYNQLICLCFLMLHPNILKAKVHMIKTQDLIECFADSKIRSFLQRVYSVFFFFFLWRLLAYALQENTFRIFTLKCHAESNFNWKWIEWNVSLNFKVLH